MLNFSKDSDYVTTMVDNLLDIMTGGDHRKTKKLLDEKKKLREEEEMEEKRMKNFMDAKKTPSSTTAVTNGVTSVTNVGGVTGQPLGIKSATVSPVTTATSKSQIEDTKIEINQLKSLSEYGIDTSFLDYYGENK